MLRPGCFLLRSESFAGHKPGHPLIRSTGFQSFYDFDRTAHAVGFPKPGGRHGAVGVAGRLAFGRVAGDTGRRKEPIDG